jgi:hypothetical protein
MSLSPITNHIKGYSLNVALWRYINKFIIIIFFLNIIDKVLDLARESIRGLRLTQAILQERFLLE